MPLNKDYAQKYRSLNEWFKTPQGIAIAKSFMSELRSLDKWSYGNNFLQLGSCGENIWLPILKFNNKWIVNPYYNNISTSLCAVFKELPLARDSIDCIMAPLSMEAASNDIILDEIDRVLKPSGIVIFFGINPLSLWGMSLKLGYLDCFGTTNVRLQSSLLLKRNLSYRGFKPLVHKNFYFIPPVIKENIIHKLNFLNEMGKMIWPFPAGFYCLVLQKFQYEKILNLEHDAYFDDEVQIEMI